MNALTLEEIEQRIYETYHMFAREAPGVAPQETGELGTLWRLFDEMMAKKGGTK